MSQSSHWIVDIANLFRLWGGRRWGKGKGSHLKIRQYGKSKDVCGPRTALEILLFDIQGALDQKSTL